MFSRLARRGLAVGAAVALIAPAVAASAATSPGSDGAGDSYYPRYGNGGYDVSHYKIAIDYDPASGLLTGDTTITARATQDLSQFDLDFLLPVTSATVNGQPATTSEYAYDTPARNYGGELVVTPAHSIRRGTALTVRVKYAGKPADVQVGGFSPWFPTPTGAVIADEAEASAWWFPANDHPTDKATYDVSTTVPAGVQAIGNGRLAGTATHGAKTTYRWREDLPMATYLAFVAIGKYTVTTGHTRGGVPFTNAIAKQDVPAAAAGDIARTPEVIDWETKLWGPYPFDSTGGVVPDLAFGYALETQTRPTYSSDFWDDGSDIYVVVHENAHQWFGDSVSVSDWSDIWLNEGFAVMTEWLWSETHGDGSAQSLFDSTYAKYPASDPFWTVKVGDPGAAKIFSTPIYERGPMVLQALRNRIGDGTFLRLLRVWALLHRHGNASIAQFESLAELLSGQDLDGFFQTWLFTPSKPAASAENGFLTGAHAAPAAQTAPASLPQIQRVQHAAQAAARS
ncbi:MAG TPA: M1 family metallopeptidase [Jatrophihabitantaceae bacterium]